MIENCREQNFISQIKHRVGNWRSPPHPGRGRGRAGVQGRGGGTRRWGNPPMVFQSNNEPDVGNVIPPFTPGRPPGFDLEGPLFRNTMRTAFEFFQLFFLLVKW